MIFFKTGPFSDAYKVGGVLIDNFIVENGLKTFPAV